MEQLELTFRADNQLLEATNFAPPLYVASNTVSWIKAKFELGTNWGSWGLGAVKAMWKFKGEVYSAVLDANGVCTIPHEVLGAMTGEVKVNLVASTVEDGEVVERMTTYPLHAINVNKVAQIEGDNSVAVTPSEFEQFVEQVQEYAQDAVDAKEDAESAQASAEQARDEAVQAEQSILGLEATAEVDANVGTPSVAVSVTTEDDHKVMAFDFHNLKGEQGERGADGQQGADGFSPIVTTTPIEGGTEVDIEDAQGHHTFNVLNGDVSNFYPFLPTDTANGDIANFPDGADQVPMLSLVADIDPIQDLHGQDAPYPAGGGANQWDEEWELGTISQSTGQNAPSTTQIRSKNYIPVLPSTTYYNKGYTLAIFQYDADKNFIGYANTPQGTFTTGGSCYFIRFYRTATTYNHDIAINYPSTVTTYSPYSNICPITGRDEVTVVRTGKNLFDKDKAVNNERYNASGTISYNNSFSRSALIRVLPSTSYYFQNVVPSGDFSAIWWYDKNGVNVGYKAFAGTAGTPISGTATSPANAYYVGVNIFAADIDIVQVTQGSSAPTAYEPYSAVTITTQLGQTVYGGTLDVVSGRLVVTDSTLVFDDTAWGFSTNFFYRNVLNAGEVVNGYYTTENGVKMYLNGNNGQARIYLADNPFLTSSSDVGSFLNGYKLVYPLATPITIQLTPTEVKTLLGTNNVWADSGDTEVTYKADIQKYIDKQISAVLNA